MLKCHKLNFFTHWSLSIGFIWKNQTGIPTVKVLMNQLITNPLTTKSIIHATFSYSLFLNISIMIISTNPIHRLAIKNSKEATIVTFTMQIDSTGNFCLINSIVLLMNFTNLYCCSGSFCIVFIAFTLFPKSSTVSSRGWWCIDDKLAFWAFGNAEAVFCLTFGLSISDLLFIWI